MKVRQGFVSNSSSSSFVCAICGNADAGMDASPSDFGMAECENGHTFCTSHSSHQDLSEYDTPAEKCPVCSLKEVLDEDILTYIVTKNKLNVEDLVHEIKGSFSNLKDLEKYFKSGELPEKKPKKLRLRNS